MPEIKIQFKPSIIFLMLLSVITLGSVAVIYFLPLTLWMRSILMAVSVGYGIYILFHDGLQVSSKSITGLCFNEAGWWIQDHQGLYQAKLLGDSTVTKTVCVLRFKLERSWFARSCVVWRDSLPSDLYRKLTVLVKWVPLQ